MANWLALPALIWAMPGFLVQMYGVCFGHALAAILGTMLLVWGLTVYSSGKGYSPFWGVWGVVPILGVLVLIVSRPRLKSKPREMLETILLEEDPSIRPSTTTMREAPVGGTWLLALMAPLGILLVVFSGYVPPIFQALENSRTQAELAKETADETLAEEAESTPGDVPENPSPALPVAAPPAPELAASTAPEIHQEHPTATEFAPPPAPELAASTAPEIHREQPPAVEPAKPPTPEKENPPPVQVSFADQYKQVVPGMSVEQVNALCGDKTDVISEMLTGGKIVRWESPKGDSFAARFYDDKLDIKTPLYKAPVKTKIGEMANEIADVKTPNAMPPKNPPPAPPPPAPAEPVQAAQPAEDETDEDNADVPPPAPSKVIRIGGEAQADGRPRKARLPRYTYPIDHGPNGINFYNLKDSKVSVGIRTENRGQNISIPAGGMTTINIPNGNYTVHFIDTSEPNELKDAGTILVNSPRGAINFTIH